MPGRAILIDVWGLAHGRGRCCAMALAALLAGACSDDTNIIGECKLVTDATPVVADAERVLPPVQQSVGRLGELSLVSWGELEERDGEVFATFYARWLDQDLASIEDVRLGRSAKYYHRPTWVAADERLTAQMWVDPDEGFPLKLPQHTVHLCSITPGATTVSCDPVEVRTAYSGGLGVFSLGQPAVSAGIEASIPVALQDSLLWATMTGVPAQCADALGNLYRLMVVREGEEQARPIFWDRPRCNPESDLQMTTNPYLVPLEGRGMGVLLRVGDTGDPPADGQVKLLTLGDDAQPLGPPVDVGSDHELVGTGPGYQPRGVAVDGRLLFTERRASTNRCHALRVARLDGSHAHDAPWQLPCMRHEGRWRTASHALLEVPGGAALIWGERTRIDTLSVTANTEYEERIRAVLLTPKGKRGSEVVTVTDPEATVLSNVPRTENDGPFPRDFLVAAAADGGEITVAWRDERAEAPGIYARRLRCRARD